MPLHKTAFHFQSPKTTHSTQGLLGKHKRMLCHTEWFVFSGNKFVEDQKKESQSCLSIPGQHSFQSIAFAQHRRHAILLLIIIAITCSSINGSNKRHKPSERTTSSTTKSSKNSLKIWGARIFPYPRQEHNVKDKSS